jgi:hypothetical protein
MRRQMSKRQNQLVDLVLGPLPVEMVNLALGLELDPGLVVLSRATQIHARRRHPTDYPVCLPFVGGVIADPLYIGDDFKNSGIELIAFSHSASSYILVAIGTRMDHGGNYQVASFYPVSRAKIDARRGKGFLHVAKKKGPDRSGP